jgi:hypothetical protein
MAIRNSDVIAQAMERLPLHKAWTVPPKARRANAVAPRRKPTGERCGAAPLVPRGRANERRALRAADNGLAIGLGWIGLVTGNAVWVVDVVCNFEQAPAED